MNKGRIGWGKKEIEKYAPEFLNKFKLLWLAVKKELLEIGICPTITCDEIVPEEVIQKAKIHLINDDYFILPVHPWQWNHYIHNQFFELITNDEIIVIGAIGDDYSPQSSIRTFSNVTSPKLFDLKLSVSILNTSCVRGIPSKYIKDGHNLSKFISNIIKTDSYLNQKIDVLEELCAVRLKSKYFDDVKDCSYRYKEFFGSIWRESVYSKVVKEEYAVPCASLLIKNKTQSYLEYLIENSKVSTEEWIRKYIQVVILPLYYLQIHHGIGLVAHGQNIILVLKNSLPERLIIKDFHGDLRISTNSIHISKEEINVLEKLPPHYLIHDLLTGHFITVVRYISRLLSDESLLSEEHFYSIAGEVISQFNDEYGSVGEDVNLLKTHIEKILVNKVRFIAGYSETNTRLKPCLGSDISNPMKSRVGENRV